MSKQPVNRRPWRRPVFWVALSIPALLALYLALIYSLRPESSGREVSFSAYMQRLRDGDVESATLLSFDSRILFRSRSADHWTSLPTNGITVDRVLETSVDQGVRIDVDQQTVKSLTLPATYIIPGVMFLALILLLFLLQRSGSKFLKSAARRGTTDRRVTFADVAGIDEAVEEIREVRDFLMHPERFREIGAEPPRGILLVGPPGTGKTLLARAVAGEAGVPFYSVSGTDFVEMYVGVGAARVRDLFQQVRANAPAILFIDELDAAGRARSGTSTAGQDERDQTLNQLLVEMDGFDRYSGVVLIGATNRPDVLDPAILRRGRFDRQIVVDRPDRAGRLAVLEVHARAKRLAPEVNLESLAARTPGMTGADLASVLNEAALLAARRGRSAIGPEEVDEAIDRVVAGNERRTRVLSPEEKRAVAYHEGGHAIVAWALPGTDPVTKITIVSRGDALGLTWMVPEEDRFIHTRSELLGRMAVSMGGMAAEELVLGEPTTGPQGDLRKATRLARQMVCELGMNESLGRMSLGRPVNGPYLGGDAVEPDYSEEMAASIDREVRRLTDDAYRLAKAVLVANRELLDRLASALIERETLRDEELDAFAVRVVRHTDPSLTPGEKRLAIRGVSRTSGRAGSR